MVREQVRIAVEHRFHVLRHLSGRNILGMYGHRPGMAKRCDPSAEPVVQELNLEWILDPGS